MLGQSPDRPSARDIPLELRDVYSTDFTLLTAPGGLAEAGDLWANILDEKHDLGAMLEAAGDAED